MKVGSKVYVVLDDDGDIVDLSGKKEEAIFMAGVAARAMHNHSMTVVEATINTMVYGVCYGGEVKKI